MVWSLRRQWRLSRRDERLVLTIGSAETEIRRIGLTLKDVWNLRQGTAVLRDGLLVVPDEGKLRFLLTTPALEPANRLFHVLDAEALNGNLA
jgi:hypothetical protein